VCVCERERGCLSVCVCVGRDHYAAKGSYRRGERLSSTPNTGNLEPMNRMEWAARKSLRGNTKGKGDSVENDLVKSC